MNKKLVLILCGGMLVFLLVPWDKIWSRIAPGRDPDSCAAIIDSLENEMNEARMNYMRAGNRISELNDSLYQMSRIIDRNNNNYTQLKRQNEKLQKERAALINSFTDSDIERYLSNRYDK